MVGFAPRSLLGSALLASVVLPACGSSGSDGAGGGAYSSYRVVNTYPHDPEAYCQGLLYANGKLYESTGRNGTSSVRRVDLMTGAVEEMKSLPVNLFGEGLALHGGELYQLTWHAGKVHVFELETLKVVRNFTYDGEGWGLTSDGTHLYHSDGSSVIHVRDPETFDEVRILRVKDGEDLVTSINELEWIEGELWANIWKDMRIARIDPKTGAVTSWVDLTGIFDPTTIPDPDAVLNGIAYDSAGKRIFVTGKLWPSLFEIEVVP